MIIMILTGGGRRSGGREDIVVQQHNNHQVSEISEKLITSKKQRDKMLFMSPSSELKLDLTFRELQGLRS